MRTGKGGHVGTRKWAPILIPFAVALLGSQVYSSLIPQAERWGQVLASLYYIPIVIAAIALGERAAFTVAVIAGAVHMLAASAGHGDPWIESAAQALIFACVAWTASRLAERRSNSSGATSGESQAPVVEPVTSVATGNQFW